jgi:hypothetical protein
MPNSRLLLRHLSTVQTMSPGEWTNETATGKPAIACPECGGISELELPHVVRGGGIVTPIWSCPYICPAMEFITLVDWDEAVLR